MYSDLKPGKHLVLDNTNIADTYRLRRRVHQPTRDPDRPILKPEKPWEGATTTPLHVVFDPQRPWRVERQARDVAHATAARRVLQLHNLTLIS